MVTSKVKFVSVLMALCPSISLGDVTEYYDDGRILATTSLLIATVTDDQVLPETTDVTALPSVEVGPVPSGDPSLPRSKLTASDIVEGDWTRPVVLQQTVAAANRYGLPEQLFIELVRQESGFAPTISSPVGAYGLAQLMPGTASDLGVNIANPLQNLDGGARYLLAQFNQFGSWELALAAYNAGPGAVQRYGGIPPYRETQNYVSRIMSKSGILIAPDMATASRDLPSEPQQNLLEF